MTLSLVTTSEQQTIDLAARFAAGLRGGDVLALDGPLGSGKTCFVRGLARGLGIDPHAISSPTFVICQEHLSTQRNLRLVHVDAYRLNGPEDLSTIGWDELLADPAAVMAVEWADRLGDAIPPTAIGAQFEHVPGAFAGAGPGGRRITIDIPSAIADRFTAALDHDKPASVVTADENRGRGGCPICGKEADPSSPRFPFCSPRCRLADLGRWFAGRYTLSRPLDPQDQDENDLT